MAYNIAIIEDDKVIADKLSNLITQYGYLPHILSNFVNLDKEIELLQPHIILLDINLPYYNGFYWCQKIRKKIHAPIIIISAREGTMDQIMAIENGADDYITKPFEHEIVIAKIKSQIRRTYGDYKQEDKEIEIKGLVLQPDKLKLVYNGKGTFLSSKEMILLKHLLLKHGAVVKRELLFEKVWDNENFVDGNTLNVNINRIRKKLEELGLMDVLTTIRGKGYRLLIETKDL